MKQQQVYISSSKLQQHHIERVDEMVRENNKKYIDQKSQLQYQKALLYYEKQRKRQQLKQYAQNIKQGNKKAIQKQKLKNSTVSKSKASNNNTNTKNNNNNNRNRIPIITSSDCQQNVPTAITQPPIHKQKLSQKQIKKVQRAIEVRAERHLQQLQLQRINKKLQQQKKKTKLYELRQTCSRLLSKSHKRIPAVSQKIPQSRRVLLQEYTRKAQQEVEQLDGIIAGLIDKSKTIKAKSNKQLTEKNQKGLVYQHNNSNEQLDVFSDEFQMNFMSEMLLGGDKGLVINNNIENQRKVTCDDNTNINNNSNSKSCQDILFTKSTKELFQMHYIPIQY